MELKEIFGSYFSGVLEEHRKKLVDEFKSILSNVDRSHKDNKLFSLSEFSRIYNISRPTINKLIKSGIIPIYQLPRSSKKYLKSKDFYEILERVDIPIQIDTYEDFEREFRFSIKRGKKVQKLINQYKLTEREKSISDLSLWLWKNGYKKEIFKGVVMPDFESPIK